MANNNVTQIATRAIDESTSDQNILMEIIIKHKAWHGSYVTPFYSPKEIDPKWLWLIAQRHLLKKLVPITLFNCDLEGKLIEGTIKRLIEAKI